MSPVLAAALSQSKHPYACHSEAADSLAGGSQRMISVLPRVPHFSRSVPEVGQRTTTASLRGRAAKAPDSIPEALQIFCSQLTTPRPDATILPLRTSLW
jgi:hypothetical protein